MPGRLPRPVLVLHFTFVPMQDATFPNRVILVEPEMPENVGFAARAMSCFGWTDLAIVGRKPDRESAAYRTATLGKEILDAATEHPDLVSAFGNCRTTVAFTRRPHQKGLVDLPHLAASPSGPPLSGT